MRQTTCVMTLVLFALPFGARVAAQEAPASFMESERAALEQAIQSYVAAFNARDAKGMAERWSPEGVYISRLSGERVVGREAIAAAIAETFASEEKPQLAVATESIEFISPNVAIERGTATVANPDGSAIETAYRGIYVRRDGKWLIDRMTEDESPRRDSSYEKLKELEWLIGDWVDQAGDDTIRFECKWTRNRNYISRAFTVGVAGRVESSGLQVIGWDPGRETIRSWLFDSGGGFVEGTWKQKDSRWYVESVGRLPDGSAGSFTSIIRPLDRDSYSWQKVHRVVEGRILPNVDEVIITRQ